HPDYYGFDRTGPNHKNHGSEPSACAQETLRQGGILNRIQSVLIMNFGPGYRGRGRWINMDSCVYVSDRYWLQ
ncbi:unnamed protein product, partial [Calicophoron daubneyi]